MKKMFCGARIYDACKEEPIENGCLLIEDRHITACGPANVVKDLADENTEVIDVTGKTIIPGLIDAHVHMLMSKIGYNELLMTPKSLGYLRCIKNFRNTIKMGFTTVRDCGGSDVGVKRAIEEDLFPGPRLYTCGILTPTGGHNETYFPIGYRLDLEPGNTDSVFDGISGVRRGARTRIMQGYDFVKITATGGINDPQTSPFAPEYTVEEIKAIVEVSKMSGKEIVVAHCHGGEGARYCLEAGLRSIEHGTWLEDELLDKMVEMDAYYVPTFLIGWYIDNKANEIGVSTIAQEKSAKVKGILEETFSRAIRKGVKIVLGTDAATEDMHGQNAMELVLRTKAGQKPIEALFSATRTAAELLGGLDKFGTLESGKYADFLVLEKNPLEDFSVLLDEKNILSVFKEGKDYKPLV